MSIQANLMVLNLLEGAILAFWRCSNSKLAFLMAINSLWVHASGEIKILVLKNSSNFFAHQAAWILNPAVWLYPFLSTKSCSVIVSNFVKQTYKYFQDICFQDDNNTRKSKISLHLDVLKSSQPHALGSMSICFSCNSWAQVWTARMWPSNRPRVQGHEMLQLPRPSCHWSRRCKRP